MNGQTKTPIMHRAGLQGFIHCPNGALQYDYDMQKELFDQFGRKLRNIMTMLHTLHNATLAYADGMVDLIKRNEEFGVNEKTKEHLKHMTNIRQRVLSLDHAIEQSMESGFRMCEKTEYSTIMNNIGYNYNMLVDVLQIAMDCQVDGDFNRNGRILVDMPESVFNSLKIPGRFLKQMNIYGSEKDREEEFGK